MNQLNNWEKDLQRRFADHRMEPPMGGWEKLESALAPSLPSVPPTPFWRRPRLLCTSRFGCGLFGDGLAD